ncbi:glutamate receptor-like [Rhynchophorus ferrugineus]|uniref:glutamate receptor-like n=1 Tax=Rhynchophorus ferrugineus TaxID=354439 RepID=UPI003FCE52D1
MHVTNIEILLNVILQQYILPTRCITLITDHNSTINNVVKGTPTLNIFLESYDELFTIDKKLFRNYGCQAFILGVSKPAETFSKIEQYIKYQNETLTDRKYIVVDTPGTSQQALSIFQTREIDFVCDILIISSEISKRWSNNGKLGILGQSSEEYTLRTHQFVGLDRNKVVLLDRWFSSNRSFEIGANLFPDKLSNQQGRQTKIGFFHYEPYILLSPDRIPVNYLKTLTSKQLSELANIINYILRLKHFPKNWKHVAVNPKKRAKSNPSDYTPMSLINLGRNRTSDTISISGAEGELLKMFFEKHNIGKEYVLIRNEYWGDVFDNGTVYGLRGDVYKEKVDIGVAANFATDRMYRFFGISSPTLRVGVTCLVPAPKLAARWLTPTYVYTSGAWKAIFSGYIFIVMSIFYLEIIIKQNRLKHLGKFRHVALIKALGKLFFGATKQLFNQGLNKSELHRGITGTIFTITTIVFTFLLSRIYESGLSSVMTIPLYDDSIETRDDFLRSNLTWGGIQVADWINHWRNDKGILYRKAHERYIAAPSASKLRKMLDSGNFGLLIERLPQHKYHFPFNSLENSENLHLMTEDLHWEFAGFLLRKSSVLLPPLNIFVDRMNEAGIISHLLNQAIRFLMHQTSQGVIHYNANADSSIQNEAVTLKLSHVAGVFGILFLGNLFASLIFVTELIYHSRYKNK